MKRKMAAALALLMTASMLAGCGSDSSSEGDKNSEGKTTLTFWCHQNEPWVKSYEEMAEKFEKENPEYTVDVQDYPYDVYNEKIQTAITSSTAGPDIIAVWGGMAPNFIGTDALSEVPEDLAKELDEDYMEPTVGSYKKNGKYYGVPMEYNLEYGGMVVNKKLFDEAGLSYPTTWEELRNVSGSVSVQNGDLVKSEAKRS